MAGDVIPAPFQITEHDKRGLIVVTAGCTLAFVWVCFIIRVWLRLQVREWRSDDYFLAAATFLDTVQTGLIFYLVYLGLGGPQEDIPPKRLEDIGKQGFASQIFYVLTLWTTKSSILLLYMRLSPSGGHRIASWTMLVASAVWALIAIVLISIPCNPAQFYTSRAGECGSVWPKWQAITALDISTEGLIFCIAIQLVWTLHMRWKAKVLVIFAFSARLPIIMIAAIRLHYFHQAIIATNVTYVSSFYLVANQWQMSYAIISLTITGMGPFLRPFNKDLMTSYVAKRYARNGNIIASQSEGSQPSSYQMSRLDHEENRAPRVILRQHSRSRNELKDPSPEPGQVSPTSQTSIIRSAEPLTFRPPHEGLRHDAEVWVGNRTSSVRDADDVFRHLSDETRLVITKKTEMKVECDSASQA
ncbi:uncharacterized protein M421DRAFT_421842 [Didymella exigua CBS 183.55]|uniref:Rhodopsin domain-containing protein n=1 Tax=Didymella exigua CBS 183.55 TaxID=1150837 RepID=A0A6A5RKC5_9PLEO|nr:uncharacterized protein M421DRAFT_421842 [Didymella exigua CBS 183.55]KAF1927434.1 hypothetical protein M421DRAFT_421842 [Didymella exigua CBS 183.55]